MADRKRKLSNINTAEEELVDPSDQLKFVCLGGGNEVGRSCHIVQYKGKTVMLDAGMHPAYDGLAAMPFYDEYDLSTVDVLLISHFHIDHAASLPYVLAKTNFKGRVFMTHPTKAIYKWLVQDSVRVGNISSSSEQKIQLYTEADHLSTFPMIEAIDYYTTHTISSIRITPYPAGHVLGAAMFLIDIAGLKILFTGDYSREDDRHLISAEVPKNVKIDVLITESTYGIASHMPRLERESAFLKAVTNVLDRGGRALLPVFALGRAQELLLILDEYWNRHPEYRRFPIYYASNLARKCMVVYQTYISSMNDNIKRLFRERMAEAEAAGDVGKRGPWDFRFIRSLKNLERFEDVGGCVMLASPGMMQNGVSRELLERWAPDQRNGVIVTGYSVEGTMAKIILQEPETIQAIVTRGSNASRTRGPMSGRDGELVTIPRRCSVQEYSFAAHVDGQENREFIEEVAAPVVILVHGEKSNMMRLKSKLLSLNVDKPRPVKIYSPANGEELLIPFKADKIAKVVGKLAQIASPLAVRPKVEPDNSNDNSRDSEIDGQNDTNQLNNRDLQQQQQGLKQTDSTLISGVLVQNDFKMSLMAPEDLREYAGLTTTTITCRQRITLAAAGFDLIRWSLEGVFGSVRVIDNRKKGQNGNVRDSELNGLEGIKLESNGTSKGKMDIKQEESVEAADEEIDSSVREIIIMDCVSVKCRPAGDVEVVWEGNVLNDGIADAVLAALVMLESSPAAVKYSSRHAHKHTHQHIHRADLNANNDTKSSAIPDPVIDFASQRHPHAAITDPAEQFSKLCLFLEAQFGDAITPMTEPRGSSSSSSSSLSSPSPSEQPSTSAAQTTATRVTSTTPAPPESESTSSTDHPHNEAEPASKQSTLTDTNANANPPSSNNSNTANTNLPQSLPTIKTTTPPPVIHGLRLSIDNDKYIAKIWLKDLDVECSNAVLRDRIKAVVERAIETVEPLWRS